MKKKLYLVYIIGIVVSGMLIISFASRPTTKIVYVNLPEVFEQFELKKELTLSFEKGTIARDEMLNEMYLALEQLARKTEENPTEELIKEYREKEAIYYHKKEQFETQKITQLDEYDAQILKQLNQYVKDFGEKKGIDVLMGANGQGTLMYCDESMNMTKEVVEYINSRYLGDVKK